ncbi:DMT family transporter [Thalassococcus sp. BH17M4-6]|uniref:DMT family transporter n=1 Tax=Thalassococcus sp. BH17M4-6 TaxID=3413148 RepID=UPI003BCAC4BF
MTSTDRPALGILLICAGVAAISVNDMLIKLLSGGYPLHQIVFVRSAVGLIFSLALLQYEGGIKLLRTSTPFLHLLRGLLVVGANMTFYAAVAVLPLAQATALFFVAPLFITLLAIPMLGEKVGPLRLGAVIVGFAGVAVMQRPWAETAVGASRFVLLLPVAAALLYALMQVLTRRLGVSTRASALAIYIQGTFLLVSVGFYLIAGDGRLSPGPQNESLHFLLRAWIVPPRADWPVFAAIGLAAGGIGYCLSAAYRMADAATIAPFEYIGLPLAIFWGWAIFGEWPAPTVWLGCALIVGAGLFVFLREQQKGRPLPGRRARPFRR